MAATCRRPSRVLALTEAVAAADRPAELCRVAALSDTIVVVEGGEAAARCAGGTRCRQ